MYAQLACFVATFVFCVSGTDYQPLLNDGTCIVSNSVKT
jgi:hypothetical protein